jgi:hypothetical protein
MYTKENVLQARYTNSAQDTILVNWTDSESGNFESYVSVGDNNHKALHDAGWDHAAINNSTLTYINEIFDEKEENVQAFKQAIRAEIEAENLLKTGPLQDELDNLLGQILRGKQLRDRLHSQQSGVDELARWNDLLDKLNLDKDPSETLSETVGRIHDEVNRLQYTELAWKNLITTETVAGPVGQLSLYQGVGIDKIINFITKWNDTDGIVDAFANKTGKSGKTLLEILSNHIK